ncbi:hypothetical protein P2R41_23185 [Escherichia coli]
MALKSRFIKDVRERDHVVNTLANDPTVNRVALAKFKCKVTDNLLLITILRFCFDFPEANYRDISDQFADFLSEGGTGAKISAYVNFINGTILGPHGYDLILRDSNRQLKSK